MLDKEWITKKVNIAHRIPGSLIEDFHPKNKEKREKSLHGLLQHEAGHVLVGYLKNIEIEDYNISKIAVSTKMRLRQLLDIKRPFIHIFGQEISLAHGGVTFDADAQDDVQTDLVGLVVDMVYDDEFYIKEKKTVIRALQDKDCRWNDVIKPKTYIQNKYKEIAGQDISPEGLEELFFHIMEQFKLIVREERFSQALQIVIHYLRKGEKPQKPDTINEALNTELKVNGITDEKMDQLRKALFSWDIDKIISSFIEAHRLFPTNP
jgi:hypothetical protein